jgi:hypothetical protein
MGRVFLLQRSRRDFNLSSAERFGTVVPVLGERESPSLALAPALTKMRTALRDYDPTSDHLLAAGGDQLASFLAGMVLTDEGILRNDPVSWLRWDRARDFDGRRDPSNGSYEPVQFGLYGVGARKDDWDGR